MNTALGAGGGGATALLSQPVEARAPAAGGVRRRAGPPPGLALSTVPRPAGQSRGRHAVKTKAFFAFVPGAWSAPLDALDLAAPQLPPETEIVFALQQRGIGMLECLGTLQEAPSLTRNNSAALDVAACLAQPFVIEEGNAEIMRDSATEASQQQQEIVASRYAREVAAAHEESRRRQAAGDPRRRLQRRTSLDDTDLTALGLFDTAKNNPPLYTSPSTKLMIATIHSLSVETSRNNLVLADQKGLAPPTETVDLEMQTLDHDYLMSTDAAGSVAGSLQGSVQGSVQASLDL